MPYLPIKSSLRKWAREAGPARVRRGVSQAQLAKQLGERQSFVSGVETGSAFTGKSISSDTLSRLFAFASAIDHAMPPEYARGEVKPIPKRALKPVPGAKEPEAKKTSRLPTLNTISTATLLSMVVHLTAQNLLTTDGAMRLVALAKGG